MPNENNKILKHNPGEKSMKAPFTIYSEKFILSLHRKNY